MSMARVSRPRVPRIRAPRPRKPRIRTPKPRNVAGLKAPRLLVVVGVKIPKVRRK